MPGIEASTDYTLDLYSLFPDSIPMPGIETIPDYMYTMECVCVC